MKGNRTNALGFGGFDRRYFGPMVSLLAALALLTWIDVQRRNPAMGCPTVDLPKTIGEWISTDLTLEPEVEAMLAADRTIYRSYRHPDGRAIELFWIGYGYQGEGKTMHSPRNCLPAAGWDIQEKDVVEITGGIRARYLLLTHGGYRMETLYWFQAGDEHVWDEFENKWKTLWNSFRYGRSDGALITLSAIEPLEAPSMRKEITAFAAMLPVIRKEPVGSVGSE